MKGTVLALIGMLAIVSCVPADTPAPQPVPPEQKKPRALFDPALAHGPAPAPGPEIVHDLADKVKAPPAAPVATPSLAKELEKGASPDPAKAKPKPIDPNKLDVLSFQAGVRYALMALEDLFQSKQRCKSVGVQIMPGGQYHALVNNTAVEAAQREGKRIVARKEFAGE